MPEIVISTVQRHMRAFLPGTSGYVFSAESGANDPIDPNGFSRYVWPAAVKAAGLPRRTRLHDLRHTYASVLIKSGKGPKTVAVRPGDTVAVAIETCAHLFPDEGSTTHDVVEEWLGGAIRPSAPDVPRR
ncbi:hypothetical protein ACFTWD_01360 [Streptomyces sp. NPDC056943]|uniref:hypothetical protein n=1 Tax=Streptomyces sp. NPDC056943 TaxID=3345971 RepID=UPI0036360A15